MKWVLIVVGSIVAIAVLILIVGMLRPSTHLATHTVVLAVPPESVWTVITDFERQPEWVPDFTAVERLPDRDGLPSFRESFGGFQATTVVRDAERPRLLTKEILPGGAFHGSWTWELAAEGAGTRLTVTERGMVDNPFFRGMMVFADHSKTMRKYAEALARRLGATAAVVP